MSASGWLSLEVSGGFSYNRLVDLDDPDEVESRLVEFTRLARQYMRGSWTPGVSRLRVPYILVDSGDETVKLELGIRDQLRKMLGLG